MTKKKPKINIITPDDSPEDVLQQVQDLKDQINSQTQTESQDLDEKFQDRQDSSQEPEAQDNPSTPNQIEQLQSQLLESQNAHRRALADYQNLQRQTQQEKEQYLKFANESLITQLLPLFDSFELAAQHTSDQGVQMTLKQMFMIQEQIGLERITPTEGDSFNPILHECIETVDTKDSNQDNLIIKSTQAGYQMLGADSPLRPAKVTAYKLK